MAYDAIFTQSFEKDLHHLRKNYELIKAANKKIKEILENPDRYKFLTGELAGQKRIHVLKSFVIVFEVFHDKKEVAFYRLYHHDQAY